MTLSLRDRISGGLFGLLVGDALGVPYEFCAASDLPDPSAIEFVPPKGFRLSHSSAPPCTWSDDGAQALCLLASLLERGCLDLVDFSRKLLKWYHEGAFTPDRKVFDCGIQTRAAIQALRSGAAPERSGPSGERDNGNGSLMHVLPLALWHCGSDAELYADARRQSLPTRGHLRSQLCCAFYVLWARELLQGQRDGWNSAAEKFLALSRGDRSTASESEFILAEAYRHSASGSGYVLDSLWSARSALRETDYVSVVRAAIAFGEDTDTTACLAGGPAGILDGLAGTPERWRNSLRGKEILEPLLRRLLRVVCPGNNN